MGNYYGYNRISSKEQHLDRGKENIEKFCKEEGYLLEKFMRIKYKDVDLVAHAILS